MKLIARPCLAASLLVALFYLWSLSPSAAQIVEPDRESLFLEDADAVKKEREQRVKEILVADKPPDPDLRFEAPAVEYLEGTKSVKTTGGVIISKGELQVQAEEATINTETEDAELRGNVLLAAPEWTLNAEAGALNVESETGEFRSAQFVIEEGAYTLWADRALKLSETKYKLTDCSFSTCHCPDGTVPWKINSSTIDITEESYAYAYNSTLDFHGVPIFYSPFFGFPAKTDRQTGLLAPRFGYGSEDGVFFYQPLYVVLGHSADMTLSPFVETHTRAGVDYEYRRAISRFNNLSTRFLYSNEGARGDSLRGTDTAGIFDPDFDRDRFGGYYRHLIKGTGSLPYNLVADLRYVSDDLLLREIEDTEIGSRNDRFVTSQAVFRTSLGSYAYSEISGEYNQALLTDDDLIFQRLPEVGVSAGKSFRPFGFNPYGLKVTPKVKLTATDFVRSEGFDGWRLNAYPSVRVPFHFRNYLSSQADVGFHQTAYELREDLSPSTGASLDDSQDRTVFRLSLGTSTVLERVYELPEHNILTTLTSLGARNQAYSLKRVKHTIEPQVRFTHIPQTAQDDLPLFDSFDRIRQKSLFVYGVRTGLYGRFLPETATDSGIIELTPRLEDLPVVGGGGALSDFGDPESAVDPGAVNIRRGEIREIANFTIRQGYDYAEEQEDIDPTREPFSDVYLELGLYPSSSFGFKFDSNYNVEEPEFTSWGVGAHFRDDRGDILRTRYGYIEESFSQLQANLEISLTDRMSFGYYARYDDREHEFIESNFGLRLKSACDCWHLNLGVSDRINPDRRDLMVSFAFAGLGDIAQDLRLRREQTVP